MKKKNSYVSENLSFEDFEQAIAQRPGADIAVDELVRERLSAEKESREKERDLKKTARKRPKIKSPADPLAELDNNALITNTDELSEI